jgi:hypothetical protein
MLEIAIHESAPLSAVSYYRSIGTLSFLPVINSNIKINIPPRISWNSLINTDIFYIERPESDGDLEALELAKDFNIKTWVDIDDLLHEVPKYNPCYENYFDKSSIKTRMLRNFEKALKIADIVTTSTPAIKEYYSEYNSNIHVIENAHNDYRYTFEKVEDQFDSINWRGSQTHRQDLLSVADDMFRIANIYEKWTWVFIGNDIWFITDRIKRHFNIKECCTVVYNKFIKDAKAAIQIVPLLHSKFNEAKSNIGFIEGVYAGSCVVVPNLPEFDKPGAIKYTEGNGSFGYNLEKAIKSKTFRQKNYLESYDYVKENLMLSKINKKRIEIIERLL